MAADGVGSTGIVLRILQERAIEIPDLLRKSIKQTGEQDARQIWAESAASEAETSREKLGIYKVWKP